MLLQLEQNWPTIKLPFWYGQPPSPDINHVVNFLARDTRNLGDPIVQYIESHSDDVTEVSKPPSSRSAADISQLQFHPSRPQILLSGSTDGLVNIFNTTIADEEEALHQTINHGASIHHSNFLSDVDIFALSHDEKFSMYELVTNPEEGVEEPPPVHFGDMREKLGGEYVANVIRRPIGGSVIGVGTHRYVSSCWKLRTYANCAEAERVLIWSNSRTLHPGHLHQTLE